MVLINFFVITDQLNKVEYISTIHENIIFVSIFIIRKLVWCIFLAYKSKKGSLALQCTYNFLIITVIIIGYYRNYNCGKTLHSHRTELVVSESQ